MNPQWGPRQKLRFLFSYLTAKFLVPLDVSNDRWKLWCFEWRDFFQNGLNAFKKSPTFDLAWTGGTELHTKFGSYFIRPGTQDVTIVSPAFERLDMNTLLFEIDSELNNGSQVLFVDGGANIGRYAVAVMQRFADSDVRVLAFEPDAANVALLQRNVANARKGRARAEIFSLGLSDRTGRQWLQQNTLRPWDQGLAQAEAAGAVMIELTTLDEIAAPASNETVVIKLDVEGHELQVLEGAKVFLKSAKKVIFMIEDVIHRQALYERLHGLGATPLKKQTPYNSWWSLTND